MAEQLQTLTIAMASWAISKTAGVEESERRGEVSKMAEEMPPLEDGLMEYATIRMANLHNEL